MINEAVLSELKPLISDPAWQILVGKMEYLKSRALYDVVNAKDLESFFMAKGAYRQAEKNFELFKNPRSFADDGVARFPGTTDVMGTRPTQ